MRRRCVADFWRLANHVGALPTMPQRMIDKYEREHGLGYGYGADANTRVVAALRFDHHWLPGQIDRTAWQADA